MTDIVCSAYWPYTAYYAVQTKYTVSYCILDVSDPKYEYHRKSNEIRFWFTSKVNQLFPDDFFPFRSIHTSIFFIGSIKLFNKSLVHSISKKFLFWMHWIWADYKSRECPVIFTCYWVPFFTKKGMNRSKNVRYI